jgi:hypothetical protein
MSEQYTLYVFAHPHANEALAKEVAALSGINIVTTLIALEEGGSLERTLTMVKAKELAQALGLLGVMVELRAAIPVGKSSEITKVTRTQVRQLGDSRVRSVIYSFITTLMAVGVLGLSPWRTQASPLPGMSAPAQPLQTATTAAIFKHQDFTIKPLANYEVTAKVLSKRTYEQDKSSSISPVDFALGWGVMSDATILSDLTITQSNRWFYVSWQRAYVKVDEVKSSSANTHILPANDDIAKKIKNVQKDDIVQLKGYLVEVTNSSGFLWRSSLKRDDTGDGSCEILWVTDVSIVPPAQLLATR